jgi:hypothetical protein
MYFISRNCRHPGPPPRISTSALTSFQPSPASGPRHAALVLKAGRRAQDSPSGLPRLPDLPRVKRLPPHYPLFQDGLEVSGYRSSRPSGLLPPQPPLIICDCCTDVAAAVLWLNIPEVGDTIQHAPARRSSVLGNSACGVNEDAPTKTGGLHEHGQTNQTCCCACLGMGAASLPLVSVSVSPPRHRSSGAVRGHEKAHRSSRPSQPLRRPISHEPQTKLPVFYNPDDARLITVGKFGRSGPTGTAIDVRRHREPGDKGPAWTPPPPDRWSLEHPGLTRSMAGGPV